MSYLRGNEIGIQLPCFMLRLSFLLCKVKQAEVFLLLLFILFDLILSYCLFTSLCFVSLWQVQSKPIELVQPKQEPQSAAFK